MSSQAVKLRTAQNHLANSIRLLPVREVDEFTTFSWKANQVLGRLKNDDYPHPERGAGGACTSRARPQ